MCSKDQPCGNCRPSSYNRSCTCTLVEVAINSIRTGKIRCSHLLENFSSLRVCHFLRPRLPPPPLWWRWPSFFCPQPPVGKGHLEFVKNFSRTSFSQMITNDFDFSLEIITARLCLAFLILFPIGVLRHSSSPSSSLSSELQKQISETWQVWCWVGAKRWPVSDRFKNELALYLDEDPNSSKYSSSVYLVLVDVSGR